MAVIKELPGVEVSITVDGKSLKEYEDDDTVEEERTVTRYVESVSNQTFEVSLKVPARFPFKGDCLAFDVTVDGKSIRTPLITKGLCRQSSTKRTVEGFKISAEMIRKLRFSSLETAADNRMWSSEPSRAKKLGRIIVKVDHVRQGEVTSHEYEDITRNHDFISEKALKGQFLSHIVELTEPVRCEKSPTYSSKPIDGLPSPFATFIFYYRSREMLKSIYIIPRTPSPQPLEERDITTLSQDELRELQNQLRAMKDKEADRVKIKKESQDSNPRPRKIARPSPSSTQLELDDDGSVHANTTPTAAALEPEVIELD